MSIFFWKREQEIERLMDSYMDEVHSCLDVFQECLCALFEDSTSEKSTELVKQVDKAESRADDFRHTVEFELYSKALMPESRGDLLGLILLCIILCKRSSLMLNVLFGTLLFFLC